MTLDGTQLDLIWAAAAGRPVVSAFRTAPIGVDTPQGAVQAGVDAEGHRHLLVPLASRHSLQEILDGDAVILRRRALEDEHRYQQYASFGVRGLWAGLGCETPDRLPIVDLVDGVYVNVGHSWGVASGPITGQVIAEIIAGEASHFAAGLSATRPSLHPEP